MKIDLTVNNIFNDSELLLDKKVTYIFGKNGTGKSTLSNLIQTQIATHDVRVFKNFDGILSEEEKLNAVVLGTENNEINKKIELEESKKKELKKNIDTIKKTITEPESEEQNFYTQQQESIRNYNNCEKVVDGICTNIASVLKNKTNPQIAKTSYNKNDVKQEISTASKLDEKIEKEYIDLLKTELKIAPNPNFKFYDLSNLLSEVNTILTKRVEERVVVERLNTSPKKEFAQLGFQIHSPGDVCSFCGSIISEKAYQEIGTYFSADEVKNLQNTIQGKINYIEDIETAFNNIVFKKDNFYPNFFSEFDELEKKLTELKPRYIDFLGKLKWKLVEKKSSLFEEFPTIIIKIPKGIQDIINNYSQLVANNNSNDLDKAKQRAKDELRKHHLKVELDSSDYFIQKSNLDSFEIIKNERNSVIEAERSKIAELEIEKNGIEAKIKELQNKTKNEKVLAENINKKLRLYVSFNLKHCVNENNKGYYSVQCSKTGIIRNITDLSTGEKNIIAFLYFIEKLEEIQKDTSSIAKIIVFDDPMTSNDDTMQYIIIDELKALINRVKETEKLIILTHNVHFYLNLTYRVNRNSKNHNFIRLEKTMYNILLKKINNDKEDFNTSYTSLWMELAFLFNNNDATETLLLNPIRRIIETFVKFNAIEESNFYDGVPGARKLFNVNSHSIDDLEADLNGRSKNEIIDLMRACFEKNNVLEHFNSYWIVEKDENI